MVRFCWHYGYKGEVKVLWRERFWGIAADQIRVWNPAGNGFGFRSKSPFFFMKRCCCGVA